MLFATALLALQLLGFAEATPKHFYPPQRHQHHRRQAVGKTTPGPLVPTGIIETCTRWHLTKSGDTCAKILVGYALTEEKFLAWNTGLEPGDACVVWLNYSYCVNGGPGAPTTRTTTTTTTPPTTTTTPAPTSTPEVSPGPNIPNETVEDCNGWRTVQSGDTCTTIEAKFGISHDNFMLWNPQLARDANCALWFDYSYCVSTGPLKYTPTTTAGPTETFTSTSAGNGTIPTSTVPMNTTYSIRVPLTSIEVTTTGVDSAWPPSKTQAGQPSNCNKWHLVGAHDDCNAIWREYSVLITEEDILAWNPALGHDCGGLLYEYWICVGVQPTTSAYIQWGTMPDIEFEATTHIAANYTDFTSDSNWVPSPTLSGMEPACTGFHSASSDDTCDSIVDIYPGILTLEQFKEWNPAVGEDCSGLESDNFYCIASGGSDDSPKPPTVTAKPSAVPEGTTEDCNSWYQASGRDTCARIAANFGTFSESQFKAWNPAVGSDCSSIAEYEFYCVATGALATSTTTTAGPTSTTDPSATPTPMEPNQGGIPDTCVRWHLVKMGDDCWEIAAQNGISIQTLFDLNPNTNQCVDLWSNYYMCTGLPEHVNGFPTPNQGSISSDCTRFYKVQPGDDCGAIAAGAGISEATLWSLNPNTNQCVDLWANYFICIGTASPGTTITSGPALPPATTSVPTTTSSGAVTTPTPTQAGMVSGCVRFYKGITGYGCDEVANAFGISEADFKAWNPALGDDCAGLWLDHYYCIGLSGPPLTATAWPV